MSRRVKRLVKVLTTLYTAIVEEDVETVETILESHQEGLAEVFLRTAEAKGQIVILEDVITHWQTYGFDVSEDHESPLMILVKKGFILAATDIAESVSYAKDFTFEDQRGMTVSDWADVLGQPGLRYFFMCCHSKHSAEEAAKAAEEANITKEVKEGE